MAIDATGNSSPPANPIGSLVVQRPDTNLYGYVLGDPINGLDPPGLFGWLDGLQLGLDIVGLVPVLGEAADLINGGISLARGDCVGAALSFAAAVPLAGAAATAGKFARKGLKYADEAVEVARETSRAARREAMRQAGVPTSRPSLSQSGTPGRRQYVFEGSEGNPQVVTQHPADAVHPNSHWHAAPPKVDPITGQPLQNNYGQFKFESGGPAVEYPGGGS